MKVKHPDGNTETFTISPKMNEKMGMRGFGIFPATSLTIADLQEKEAKDKLQLLGLQPGDTIIAVNGTEITREDQLNKQLYPKTLEQIPDDIAIISCNDFRWTEITDPPLTVVNQPSRQLGKAAAELLIKRIDNKQTYQDGFTQISVPTDIIIRKSC